MSEARPLRSLTSVLVRACELGVFSLMAWRQVCEAKAELVQILRPKLPPGMDDEDLLSQAQERMVELERSPDGKPDDPAAIRPKFGFERIEGKRARAFLTTILIRAKYELWRKSKRHRRKSALDHLGDEDPGLRARFEEEVRRHWATRRGRRTSPHAWDVYELYAHGVREHPRFLDWDELLALGSARFPVAAKLARGGGLEPRARLTYDEILEILPVSRANARQCVRKISRQVLLLVLEYQHDRRREEGADDDGPST